MGFLDKLAKEIKNYDYAGAIEKKQESLERRAHSEFRQKARSASDEELRHNLQRAIDNDNWVMEDEIRAEMDRRGIY